MREDQSSRSPTNFTMKPVIPISLMGAALLLFACAGVETSAPTLPAPQIAVRTSTPIPSDTPSPTASPTDTATPTLTPTITNTDTATPTAVPPTNTPKPTHPPATATQTPVPTSAALLAGNYPQPYNCVHIYDHKQIYEITVEWCIPTVKIEDNGNITFTNTWTADNRGQVTITWVLKPGAYNINQFVVDNLGNRYDHIATDGSARDGAQFNSNTMQTHTGWYTFSPPAPGAYKFTFVNQDWNISVPDIVLTTPTP